MLGPAIQLGPYTVQLSLINDAQQLVAPVQTIAVEAKDNERAVLPPVIFDIP